VSIVVDGESLTIAQVLAVARGGERVALAPGVEARMSQSRAVIERALGSRAS